MPVGLRRKCGKQSQTFISRQARIKCSMTVMRTAISISYITMDSMCSVNSCFWLRVDVFSGHCLCTVDLQKALHFSLRQND